MKNRVNRWLCSSSPLMVFVVLQLLQEAVDVHAYRRADFPSHFVFGASSSANQVEGAADVDGRTPSILDTFSDGLANKTKWVRACDEYHKYKEDVQLMVDTGLEAYKFSISWSRLIPSGRGAVNQKAVSYYNNLINDLLSHGIEPHVFLLHADPPQALEDEYGGWLSPKIVNDFAAYANVCFKEFGDRVLHWTTMNEPNILIPSAYDMGIFPPNRCSLPFGSCSKGNSSTEPYIVAHNMLLSHASAAKQYKKLYQPKQHGYIGLNVFTGWFRPETESVEDLLAMQRGIEFLLGWFLHPLMRGDYPKVMKKSAGSRLPCFSEYESELVKNSFDFIGVNCYNSIVVKNNPSSVLVDIKDFSTDAGVSSKYVMDDGTVVQHVLEHFKQAYGNPPIYIYENGYRSIHTSSLNDTSRIKYLSASIGGILDAVRNGSNARGYFIWSFLDAIELTTGDNWSFGLYYVDFDTVDLRRQPKHSSQWYSGFLKGVNVEVLLQVSNASVMYHGF